MKYSISNIAWAPDQNKEMYLFLHKTGYEGVEIAPTHSFGDHPYKNIRQAKEVRELLKQDYQLQISSMQSIWFGRQERLFGEEKERLALFEYTKYAIEFANVLECKNLVFGCPKNRVISRKEDEKIAIDFFEKLGEYAQQNHTVLAIEANPVIYHTNFCNYTSEALEIKRKVNKEAFKVNLDLGTMIENEESIAVIRGQTAQMNHVHISEPYLAPVQFGKLQCEVLDILKEEHYEGYVSIEMANTNNLALVKETVKKLKMGKRTYV